MKQLIVNADDFGFTSPINKGIIRSFSNGILTSASLMANGQAFEEALELSQQYPGLSIGIHLVLVEETPVLPLDRVATLVNKKGRFYNDYRQFLKRFALGKIKLGDITRELRAQIEKILKTGISASHINGHQHLHIFPRILEVTLALAEEYGIPWIRNSYDEITLSNNIALKGLAFFARRGKQKILRTNIRTSDYFLGTAYSGKLKKEQLLDMLQKLPEGISEIMCHPGENDAQLAARYQNQWSCGWKDEQDALISEAVKAYIHQQDIILTNYHDL